MSYYSKLFILLITFIAIGDHPVSASILEIENPLQVGTISAEIVNPDTLPIPSFEYPSDLTYKKETTAIRLSVQEVADLLPYDGPIRLRNDAPETGNSFVFLADYTNSPLAINAVEKQVRLFTEVLPEKFSLWLERSGRYIELIKPILKLNGLPEDLVFLPLIESGFNPYAYSRARAAGPWQFITGTAKKYGLKVNFWVDERRDPIKSTYAAAKYLKDLYERFESWSLAMAAYNAGEGKISRALKRGKTDEYWSLLKTRLLRKETKNYVAKFIAARLIAADPESYGFTEIEYHEPFEFDEVEIPSPIDLDVIANAAETTYDEIKELNPELRTWCTPLEVKTYQIRIPKGKSEVFMDNLSKIPEEKRFTLKPYHVRRGDTLAKIAWRKGIPQNVLASINGLKRSRAIHPGKVIYLPPKDKIALCQSLVKSQKAFRKKRKRKRNRKVVT